MHLVVVTTEKEPSGHPRLRLLTLLLLKFTSIILFAYSFFFFVFVLSSFQFFHLLITPFRLNFVIFLFCLLFVFLFEFFFFSPFLLFSCSLFSYFLFPLDFFIHVFAKPIPSVPTLATTSAISNQITFKIFMAFDSFTHIYIDLFHTNFWILSLVSGTEMSGIEISSIR